MPRSNWPSAKWTLSPIEVAEELLAWRAFRHLTKPGIVSYLQFHINGYDHVTAIDSNTYNLISGDANNSWKPYRRAPKPQSLEGMKELAEFLKTREFGAEVYHRLIPWLAGRSETEVWCPYMQRLLSDESYTLFCVAFRLGVSCYLCGRVQRGWNAITQNEALVRAMFVEDRDHEKWFIRAKEGQPLLIPYRTEDRALRYHGVDTSRCQYLNPVCESCEEALEKGYIYKRGFYRAAMSALMQRRNECLIR